MTLFTEITKQLKESEKKLIQNKQKLEKLKQIKKIQRSDFDQIIQEQIKNLQRQILNNKTEIRICQSRLVALNKN
jgi:hypothetical protein